MLYDINYIIKCCIIDVKYYSKNGIYNMYKKEEKEREKRKEKKEEGGKEEGKGKINCKVNFPKIDGPRGLQ